MSPSKDQTKGFSIGALERFLRLANAPVAQKLSLGLARGWMRRGPRLSPWLQEKTIDLMTRPSACCPEGGAHYRFLQRYFGLDERRTGIETIGRFFDALGSERSGRMVESYLRMALLGTLRHEVVSRERERSGVPPTLLIEAQLAPYTECNLDCIGCYTREQRTGRSANREELAFLIDEAESCGAWAVHIVGKGEPFLGWEQAEDLLAVLSTRPHLMFTIATNGTWMPVELARRLARLGNVMVLVAVDGPREIHDARRGPGTYELTRRCLETLRAQGALFGFSCMVSARSYRHVTSMEFLKRQADAGCAIGIFSKYFPLSPVACDELLMSPADEAEYRRLLRRARRETAIPILDFDDVERHTGCRSRAGISVYIDGVTGSVSPCIRTPYAPSECRLDRERGVGLAQVLAHPFFERYRASSPRGATWCGENPAGDLEAVMADLEACGALDERVGRYRDRLDLFAPHEREGRAT